MLQALLHDKLAQYLIKSPYEVEDLLTSVVIGSCAYVGTEKAILAFLREARDADDKDLHEALGDVERVDYDFWPTWMPISGEQSAGPNGPVDLALAESDGHKGEPGPGAGKAQPEVLLTLSRKGKMRALVLLEAKLFSGKSSHPTEAGPVNDQLGRYWLHLREQAKQVGAEAIAVVYLTAGLRCPRMDFQETQEELKRKGKPRAPLFWLSWRHFEKAVRQANDGAHPPAILADVLCLLVEKWGLAEVRMSEWPKAPVLPDVPWHFSLRWRWPRPPSGFQAWGFA